MNQEKIGKFIAKKRKEKSLTQEQLAEKLGVTNKSVSKWENGICLPDASLYKPLCGILDISLDELFSGEKISLNKEKKFNSNIFLIGILIIVCIIVTFTANVSNDSYSKTIEKILKTDSIVIKINDPNSEEHKLIKYKLITEDKRVKEIVTVIYNSAQYEGPVNLPSSKYYLELLNEKGNVITKVEINSMNGHFFMGTEGKEYTLDPTEEQMTKMLELIER